MSFNQPSRHHYLAVSTLFLLSSSLLCGTIYWLVGDNFDESQRTQFQLQLLACGGIIALIASVIYRLLSQSLRSPITNEQTPEPPIPEASNHTHTEPEKTELPISLQEQAPLRILAVDDNPANLMIIENYLKGQTVTISLAASGEEALEIFTRKPQDIIFMDIEMDGMDGMETTRAIRAVESSRTPIIAVSAHGEDDKKLEALAQGFDDYIAKPVNGNLLLGVVERWGHIEVKEVSPIQRSAPTNPATQAQTAQLQLSPSKPNPLVEEAMSSEKVSKIVDSKKSLEHSNQNASLAKDMLDLLIQMVTTEKPNIQTSYEQQDWDKLYQINHKLYGGSSYCGVPALQQANQALEKLLQQKLQFEGQQAESHTNQNDSDLNDELIALDNQKQEQRINKAISELLEAMDDLIEWEQQYDTAIVFGLED